MTCLGLRVGLAALGLAACGSRTGLEASIAAGTTARDASAARLDCADAGLTYIYLVAQNNDLYSYYPSAGTFTRIGAIACNDPLLGSPFSMAVDHAGVAYVVFDTGYLYRVSTKTATCERTPFVPPFVRTRTSVPAFGMAFVANGSGETLYVAPDWTPTLATIDLTTFQLHEVAPLGPSSAGPVTMAELTGTGGGDLFGFFAPNTGTPPSYSVGLDPQTAPVLSAALLPAVEQGQGWAFGFWGGDFYTFTSPGTAMTTVVTRYRPADGSIVQVATSPGGVMFVGAGVSTCAPQQ